MMANRVHVTLCLLVLAGILIGCKNGNTPTSKNLPEATKLDDYETIIGLEETLLANPRILEYKGDHLFIYDQDKKTILQVDSIGHVVQKYGGSGRGPGEFLSVNNITVTDNYLYAVDPLQYRISQFTLNGTLNSSITYKTESGSPPPPVPSVPVATNINNKTRVSLNGDILVPANEPGSQGNHLYTVKKWDQKSIATMGTIPADSLIKRIHPKPESILKKKEESPNWQPDVFVINNRAATDTFFFIYPNLFMIEQYDTTGTRIWRSQISPTPETDSLTYVGGISDKNGNLFLALGEYGNPTNNLWIHEFSGRGELTNRYRLTSPKAGLTSIFSIDFKRRRIYLYSMTEEGEVRVYFFQ